MEARFCRPVLFALFALLIFGTWEAPRAQEFEAGINAAGVIDFPTALNQTENNTIHLGIEIFDIGEPDLRAQNVRYGLQFGDFQLVADVHLLTDPERKVDFAELRAKLRIIPLDEINTNIAVGLLGRQPDDEAARARIEDSLASLFLVVTSQFFLFDSAPVLVNVYLDNIFASLGLKVGLYQFISAVGEADILHSQPDNEDRSWGKIGLEVQGEQNFYFQLYYSSRSESTLVQVGTGF